MSVAIIPARGGSKRIPRKNIRIFHGKPMISYAIAAARDSGLFEKIIVSTNDLEIANISRQYGAIVPWMRSPNLSDDFTTTLSVMQDAVSRSELDLENDTKVCCIYPAVPLLKPKYLVKGLDLLLEGKWDYVFSATATRVYPEKLFTLDSKMRVVMDFPRFEKDRTQDLQTRYQDAGQFYWGSKLMWESQSPIFSNNSTVVEIPLGATVDIDLPRDWIMAESMYLSTLRKFPEANQ
jgi:N-acylneuraminate cytidylyltransferase